MAHELLGGKAMVNTTLSQLLKSSSSFSLLKLRDENIGQMTMRDLLLKCDENVLMSLVENFDSEDQKEMFFSKIGNNIR